MTDALLIFGFILTIMVGCWLFNHIERKIKAKFKPDVRGSTSYIDKG